MTIAPVAEPIAQQPLGGFRSADAVETAPASAEAASAPGASGPPALSLLPPRMVIALDQTAARFVQTLIEGDTVLRQFPAENQLAFSRAINAYRRAAGGA